MRTLPMTSRTRLWKKPKIDFQQEAAVEMPSEGNRTQQPDRGEIVASFYRSITSPSGTVSDPSPAEVIALDPPTNRRIENLCPVCHLRLPSSSRARRRHNCGTAHLSKVADTRPPPLNPLYVDRSSFGYKVLLSQGWSEKDPYGIGAEDNKGRREPLKTGRVKNDTVGLGIKPSKVKEVVEEKKLIESGKDIRIRYEREKRIRKELMEIVHR